MNILETIIATKRKEVAERRANFSIDCLSRQPLFKRPVISLSQSIRQKGSVPIIAEFKRQSPSKGIINNLVEPTAVTWGYQKAGAAGISILTDTDFFGGSNSDLSLSRPQLSVPILRKDFIINEYQIYEAKAIGADAILLIAACLTAAEVKQFAAKAVSLGLEVLLELHDESELDCVCNEVQLVGINNRNLKNFEVNVEQSIRLAASLPNQAIRVAESGIHSAKTASQLLQNGFNALLIGEYFMRFEEPAQALQTLIHQIENLNPQLLA